MKLERIRLVARINTIQIGKHIMFILLFSLLLTACASDSNEISKMVKYEWIYKGQMHGTIFVPSGYKEETENYREGIVTYLKYADSSYIQLQHGAMYRIPLIDDKDHRIDESKIKETCTSRFGHIDGTDRYWREDNYRSGNKGKASKGNIFLLPPNIAYNDVPKNSVLAFNKALDSFQWITE